MKKIMLLAMAVTLTMSGCMRPMNQRPPHNQQSKRRPGPPPVDQQGPDRRPGSY